MNQNFEGLSPFDIFIYTTIILIGWGGLLYTLIERYP